LQDIAQTASWYVIVSWHLLVTWFTWLSECNSYRS